MERSQLLNSPLLKPLRALLSLIAPRQCLICLKNESFGESHFCLYCSESLPLLKYQADNNAAMIGKGNLGYDLDETHSLMFYYKEGISQRILHQIKYYGKRQLAVQLGRIIAEKYSENITAETILVPIPLHPKRENQRGYNQAQLIAKGISDVTQSAIRSDLLKRVINNSSQTHKTSRERREIMSATYAINNENVTLDPDQKYILVDDVITTGATVGSCARLLSQLGAQRISACSIAVVI